MQKQPVNNLTQQFKNFVKDQENKIKQNLENLIVKAEKTTTAIKTVEQNILMDEDGNIEKKINIPLKSKIDRFLLLHKKNIKSGVKILDGIIQFKEFGTPAVFARTGLNMLIDKAENSYDGDEFFSSAMKWKKININGRSLFYFKDIIQEFPFQSITGSRSDQTIRIYTFPFGNVGIVNNDSYLETKAYVYPGDVNKISKQFFLEFLSEQKSKKLQTNCISFRAKNFHPEDLLYIPSARCDYYCDLLQKYLDKGINRSILFYGMAGSGKSSLSQSILKKLNFKVMKIRIADLEQESIQDYISILNGFKFDAVMIDDIDHNLSSDLLLEYIEFFHKRVKLVFGTVNSLAKLSQALTRPGRFDELIRIDSLGKEEAIKILGPELTDKYIEKAQDWPVAYINELVIRSQIQNQEELNKSCSELDFRFSGKKPKLKLIIDNDIKNDNVEEELTDDDIIEATPLNNNSTMYKFYDDDDDDSDGNGSDDFLKELERELVELKELERELVEEEYGDVIDEK